VKNGIGTLQEKSLHAALKSWYARPGDQLEVPVDGYLVDIVRGDQLIEIQTRNFFALKGKISSLIENYPVHLVHPIALEKWILRQSVEDHGKVERRRSPKHGRLEHLFLELVRFPYLVAHPNFTLEVLFTREEEVRVNDGRGAWRRKGWSIADRRLIEVVDRVILERPVDFANLIPDEFEQPFTTRELARARRIPPYLASKMAYCLREMGLVEVVGKRRQAYLYSKR
jgi:hypothetical protein